ncbi:cytochrome P450 [Aspergillus aculeatinus CBS 121060]|uniref:Cytochrome P450 n=1 Tax=Aspergillus aculeatinus CBS 121060 TaxID=1448322 RepID=A0ACD1H4I0_9EURO|nr:putative cytochrome P450 [Aspergillus aculeatinus CBS 121060]RAH68512.1 putative cytochrome P450 [Aspergillus aculeatinus CBS 121060]
MVVGGQQLYILSSPKHISELYKDTVSFNRDLMSKELYHRAGMPRRVVDRIFDVDPKAPYNVNSARCMHSTDVMMALYRQHLSPGKGLDDLLADQIAPCILKALAPKTMPAPASVFVKGIAEAYYGPVLWEIEPNFVEWYMVWERVNSKFIFGLPAFLSRDMQTARRHLVGTFSKYFTLPQEQRERGNWWVQAVEGVLRQDKLNDHEIGCMFMLQTWAILGNMFKTAFWLVAHIVYDPSIQDAIRVEIQPALTGDQVDHQYLVEHCPHLDSLFSEVLRLRMASPMVRDIAVTSAIGGKTVRAGSRVLISPGAASYRQLHLNPDVWGSAPHVLEADRFAKDPGLRSNASYRPWGGGSTACPGRFPAKQAIFCFVAHLLRDFEIGLQQQEGTSAADAPDHPDRGRFPRADWSRPSPGIVGPLEGEDLTLVIRRINRK